MWPRSRLTRARLNPSSRSCLGGRRELKGRVEVASLEARFRGIYRPLRPPRGVLGQFDGAPQERGRRRDSAACLRSPGRALQLGGHLLVGTRGGAGTVPGPPVRIVVGVGRVGERAVHEVAILGRSRAVCGRSDKWMRELDAPADREQPGVHRWVDSRHVDLEDLGRRMQEDRITERLGGRREHEKPRVARQSAEPSCEPVFDPFRDWTTSGRANPPASSAAPHVRGNSSRASGFPWLSATISSQTAASRGPIKFSSNRARASASPSGSTRSSGDAGKDVVADARSHGADERHSLGEETASNEAKDLCRRLIEPLRIVDDAHEWLLLGELGEQR